MIGSSNFGNFENNNERVVKIQTPEVITKDFFLHYGERVLVEYKQSIFYILKRYEHNELLYCITQVWPYISNELYFSSKIKHIQVLLSKLANGEIGIGVDLIIDDEGNIYQKQERNSNNLQENIKKLEDFFNKNKKVTVEELISNLES